MISKSRSQAQSKWPGGSAYSYDLAVVRQAQQMLRNSSYPSHRRLSCSFQAGVLTLRGRVPSYYQRQLACTLVVEVPGVEQLNDCLEVVEAARRVSGPPGGAERFAQKRQA